MFHTPLSAAAQLNGDLLRVSVNWLAKHLKDDHLLVIDTRPNASYKAGHIPRSVNVPVQATFNPDAPTDRVAPPLHIRKLFSQAGVSSDTQVVLYDDGGHIDAARVFWVLEVYGHNNVRLLDGGIAEWRKLSHSVSTGAESATPGDFHAVVQPERLATTLYMRNAIFDRNTVVIDARSAPEFQGELSITSRAGHIPNAINIPMSSNIENNTGLKKLKTTASLLNAYKNIEKSKKVITYCNRGKESALTYFVLRELGFDVAHYDGSWTEWSRDAQLPIEKP